MNRSAVDFACCCVRDLFGDASEIVARFLCSKSSGVQLGDIIRGTSASMNAAQVKQSLLVLMQHNLVTASMIQPEEIRGAPRPPYHVYHANISWMLLIPR